MPQIPLGPIVYRLIAKYRAVFEELSPSDLTLPQALVLVHLDDVGVSSQVQLRRTLGMDRSTLNELVGRMSRYGWLEMERREDDARKSVMALLAKGRARAKEARNVFRLVDTRISGEMDVKERSLIRDWLISKKATA